MSASTLVNAYLGRGTHAARPSSPTVPSGGTALYYETDTFNTFAWNGSAWVQVNVGGTSPGIVQTAENSGPYPGGTSATFGAAPTTGNLLIAFVDNSASITVNTSQGWNALSALQSGGTDYSQVMWKVAGASESTTQAPNSYGSGNGGVMIYEISNAAPSLAVALDFNGSSDTYDVESTRAGGLLIGAICNNNNTNLPTAITGMTLDANSAITNRSIQGFHMTPSTAGANAVAYTFASSVDAKLMGVCVF